ARLLAEARHDEVDAHGHRGPGARPERGRARRVVGIRRIAAPAAALVAERRGQDRVRRVSATRIPRAAVVLGAHSLGVDDGALVAQLLDQHVVAGGVVGVVRGVTVARAPHVFRVEWVLEREHDAVHRQLLEVRMASVHRVELGRALERVGIVTKHLAHRGSAGRQWPLRRMAVELTTARDGTLTPDVERRERIHLAGIRDADDHAVLLLYVRVRSRRLHASVLEWLSRERVEIGKEARGLDRLGGKAEWHTRSDGAGYGGNGS